MNSHRHMRHNVPSWVPECPEYFLTICCEPRRVNQLCLEPTASVVLNAAKFYLDNGTWWTEKFLLMPDHLHAFVSVAPNRELSKVIGAFKRFTAREGGIRWQKNYFEHRLRSSESAQQKWSYVQANPVRAGLVERAEDWAFVLGGYV